MTLDSECSDKEVPSWEGIKKSISRYSSVLNYAFLIGEIILKRVEVYRVRLGSSVI
jgi:hypothetical protein